MKYGNLHQVNVSFENSDTSVLNIGDPLQMLQIQNIYNELGISEHEIVPIRLDEMKDYDGEPLILPLNFGLIYKYYYTEGKITISDKIRPIFLAVTLAAVDDKTYRESLFNNQWNIDYLRRMAPIGCRDEYTYLRMREQEIPSYLNGCLTATLPKRSEECAEAADKIYFIDAPKSLTEHIPKHMFNNCVFATHQYYVPLEFLMETKRVNEFVRNKYNEYRDNARLVITSRLHAAAPCIAMGIPVILAMDVPDHRYGWLEKLTPLYTPESFGKIQWDPVCPSYEDIKEKAKDLAKKRICGIHNTDALQQEIGTFFEDRPHASYVSSRQALHENTASFDRFADRHWENDMPIRYALWGLTESAELWYQHISGKYPHARLEAVIDSFKDTTFHGLQTQQPCILEKDDNLYVIVIATGAAMAAKELLKKIKKPKELYCLAAETFLSEIPY